MVRKENKVICVAFTKKVMLWKFYDAHKEKIYQAKVREKKL